jgi:hypothetical protein
LCEVRVSARKTNAGIYAVISPSRKACRVDIGALCPGIHGPTCKLRLDLSTEC